MKKRNETFKNKDNHSRAADPLDRQFGFFKDDPYWDNFVRAIKRERAKSDRLAREPRK